MRRGIRRERQVLTIKSAGERSPFGAAIGAIVATLFALVALQATAQAGSGVSTTNCVGGWRSYTCATRWGPATDPYVRLVPPPSEEEMANAQARDRRWIARCHPALWRDRYGVARYHYTVPGCEFGVGED